MKYRLAAKCEDGFTYFANKKDVSRWDKTRNAYWDILNKLPDAHGRVTHIALFRHRFFAADALVEVPEGATPLYEVDRRFSINTGTGEQKRWDSAFRIGYELRGKKEMTEIY